MSDAIEAAARALNYEMYGDDASGSGLDNCLLIARVVVAAYRDSEIDALRAKLLEWQQAFANQVLRLADCQAVIRSRGHDVDCPAVNCAICGNPPSSTTNHYFGSLPSHNFQPGPCSDACGHDRTTGEKA